MAYQLIYTSAARLLDSPLSGYGVVARSEVMSMALVNRLVELSDFKEPAEQGIAGPQFSYRIEECGSKVYHILTSVRAAGADYSQRSCHIAHHIALTEDEVKDLCRSSNACTPAGIILAMELRRAWAQHWTKEPETLPDDFPLPLEEIPSVDNSPTWLVFTGESSNSRVFLHPMYRKGGLYLVPQRTQARDILRLLHEALVLLPSLGWDIGFCTYSVDSDALDSSMRLFCPDDSGLVKRARRVDFPTLEIRPRLELPDSSATPMAKLEPMPLFVGVESAATPHEPVEERLLSALPTQQQYNYVEDRSLDIFPTPWRQEQKGGSPKRVILLYAVLVLLAAVGVFWAARPKNNTPSPSTHPNQHSTAKKSATTSPSTPQTTGNGTAKDSTPTHHSNKKPSEVIAPPIVEKDPEPDNVPADDSKDADETDTHADDNAQVPVEPRVLTPGKPEFVIAEHGTLPEPLQKLLSNIPEGGEHRLQDGVYIICLAEKTDNSNFIFSEKDKENNDKPLRFEETLTTRQQEVIVYRKNENTYHLTLTAAENAPQIILTINNKNVLRKITTAGKEGTVAAIQLPVVSENDELIPVFLIPEIRLYLKPQIPGDTIEGDVQSRVDRATANKFKLDLKDKKKYLDAALENVPKTDEVSIRMSDDIALALPGFSLPDKVKIDNKVERYILAVKNKNKDHTPDEIKRFELSVKINIREAVKAEMDKLLTHSYIGSGKKGTYAKKASLVDVYEVFNKLGRKLEKRNDRHSIYVDYCELFENDALKDLLADEILGDVLRSTGSAYIEPKDGDSKNTSQTRKEILHELEAHGDEISDALRNYLNDKLKDFVMAAYRKHLRQDSNRYYLKLKKVSEKDGELIWTFELQDGK